MTSNKLQRWKASALRTAQFLIISEREELMKESPYAIIRNLFIARPGYFCSLLHTHGRPFLSFFIFLRLRISSEWMKYPLFLIVVAFFRFSFRFYLFIIAVISWNPSTLSLSHCVPFQELNLDMVRILQETPLIHLITQRQETGATATCTLPGSWSGSIV